jgi:hypothetical protein
MYILYDHGFFLCVKILIYKGDMTTENKWSVDRNLLIYV